MAAKKSGPKKTKRELHALAQQIFEGHRATPNETEEAAAARASACVAALRDAGFSAKLEKYAPLSRFVAEHGSPVVLERHPTTEAALQHVEQALGAALPASYRQFMLAWGEARFFRANPAEAAYVLDLDDAARLRAQLQPPFTTLAQGDAARAQIWPVCPYYAGAFLILADGDASSFVCWNANYRPEVTHEYGASMQAWFTRMVDWTLTEVAQWVTS